MSVAVETVHAFDAATRAGRNPGCAGHVARVSEELGRSHSAGSTSRTGRPQNLTRAILLTTRAAVLVPRKPLPGSGQGHRSSRRRTIGDRCQKVTP